jgi:mucin-19
LLDPTNVTIAATTTSGGATATGSNYASNITAFGAQAAAATINTADIQNAINAGTSVNIVASGTITQSGALTFANSSGTAATFTLDNTSGSKQNITLSGGIAATGSSTTNIAVKSAGGGILSTGVIKYYWRCQY